MSEVNQETSLPTPEQQGNASTAGPQPNLSFTQALAGSPNTPSTSTPASAAPITPATPKPTPEQQAAVADNEHHSRLGKLATVLLGKQVQYVPDPATGTVKPVEVPQKPGDFFRHLVAGMLLGGAAAQGTNSPLAGFTRGATAGMQANQAFDQQRYARAQDALRNQQTQRSENREDERLKQETVRNSAQLEHWNTEQLLHEQDANLRGLEFNRQENENSVQVQKWINENDGIAAPIKGNNDPGNGKALQSLFTNHPEQFQPPKGYDRIITKDHDFSGLIYDGQKGYVDAEGKPVNLEDRATWHVSFIPQKPEPIEVSGTQLKKMFPRTLGEIGDPKKTYRMTFHEIMGLATKEHEVGRIDEKERMQREHDELRADVDFFKSEGANLTRMADEATRAGDTKRAEELRQESKEMYDKVEQAIAKSNPHSILRKIDHTPKPVNLDIATLQSKIPAGQLHPNEVAIFDKNGNFKGVGMQDSPEVKQYIQQGYIAVPPKQAAQPEESVFGKVGSAIKSGVGKVVDSIEKTREKNRQRQQAEREREQGAA
jgi:hypothetical protein